MRVAVLKVDNKGRLQLPSSFCKANGVRNDCPVLLETINGNDFAVRLTFCNNKWKINRKEMSND